MAKRAFEEPIESLICQLARQTHEDGQLASEEEERDVGGEQEEWSERDEGQRSRD